MKSLKNRLAKLEAKTLPQQFDEMSIFFVGAYPVGQESPLLGYQHETDVYLRLPDESDEELKERVSKSALAKTEPNSLGYKIALIHEICADNEKLNQV
jgi:hypothetical protein